jgi:sterol desaturase/sphingolipid hydroxylase (fatty acid hydroxylase superfamily)
MSPDSEALLRLAAFAGVFGILAAAEVAWPFRRDVARYPRWFSNLGISVLNTLVVRALALVLPVLPVVIAMQVEGEGLLAMTGLGGVGAALAGFLVLDLAVYMQHVVFHHVPWFWRLHRVHHADTQFDVTTAIRFHPLEIIVSLAWKVAVIIVFGIPAMAVLAFEIVLNAGAMFSHANISLPAVVDRLLRGLIVTPDMHRVHHSTVSREINSNFGFNLSVWDRLFGTYMAAPAGDAREMPLGLPSYRNAETARLGWLLVFPFRGGKTL